MNIRIFNSGMDVEAALGRLGKRMVYDATEPVALVVCGGSALNVLNLAERPTGDVDVLAMVEESSDGRVRLTRPKALPKTFTNAVAQVAADMGLPLDWLNIGPVRVLDWGEPDGFCGRLIRREYGPSLTVFYVSRLDQIHFKLLASLDPKSGARHMEDLATRLKPDREEVEMAARWLLKKNKKKAFLEGLQNIISGLGYDDISNRFSQ